MYTGIVLAAFYLHSSYSCIRIDRKNPCWIGLELKIDHPISTFDYAVSDLENNFVCQCLDKFDKNVQIQMQKRQAL